MVEQWVRYFLCFFSIKTKQNRTEHNNTGDCNRPRILFEPADEIQGENHGWECTCSQDLHAPWTPALSQSLVHAPSSGARGSAKSRGQNSVVWELERGKKITPSFLLIFNWNLAVSKIYRQQAYICSFVASTNHRYFHIWLQSLWTSQNISYELLRPPNKSF